MSPAAQLVVSLRERGIVFIVRGDDGRHGRLWVRPAAAWASFTDEERQLIREHRDELKKIARGDLPTPVSDAPPSTLPRSRPSATGIQDPVIPESEYDALGLRVRNGVVTHALGDAFADAILAGRVTREEAAAMKRRTEQEVNERRSGLVW